MIHTSNGEASLVVNPAEYTTIGFFLERTDEFDHVEVCNNTDFSVWFNGQLKFPSVECFSLRKTEIFGAKDPDIIYVSLYCETNFEMIDARLYRQGLESVAVTYPILERSVSGHHDFYIVALLLFLMFLGYVRWFHFGAFSAVFSLQLFRRNLREYFQQKLEVNTSMIVQMVMLSMLVAFSYWFANKGTTNTSGLLISLISWLKYTGIIMGVLLLKLYFVQLISKLNSFESITQSQLGEFVRLALHASMLHALILQLNFWLFPEWQLENTFLVTSYYLLFYLVFVVKYFIQVTSNTRYKKLHIFSYLCTTEILGAFLVALIFT
ncbi:MAG: DUF4271 domain-containing protein [Cyclobacteriaceae bacterium]